MPQPSHSDRLPSFWVAWTVVLLLIVGFEAARWANPETRTEALTTWLCGPEADWLPFLPIFLAGLVFWKSGVGSRGSEKPVDAQRSTLNPQRSPSPPPPLLPDALISLTLGLLAVAIAARTGWTMQDLPPAYHDEFSYLFQTLTFLEGRTSFPSFEPMPELFNQMHVLNEGRFASRYFPGAGAWFAEFHGVGSIWGLWIAHGIVTTGASIVAGQIAGRTARVIAGLATVFSPGLCLFSQLYLAHLPTLVGLTLFLVWMLRLRSLCESGDLTCPTQVPVAWALAHAGALSSQKRGLKPTLLRLLSVSSYLSCVVQTRWPRLELYGSSFLAGCGLSFAMLCRPMTAAGVGLPFGIWLFYWAFGSRESGVGSREPERSVAQPSSSPPPPLFPSDRSTINHKPSTLLLPLLLSMSLPLLAGIALQLAYNHSITGKALVSPYQLYTDIYTPRHVYGFNNVERGEQHLGPKVLDHYDRWAENLTLSKAGEKMGIRIVASGRWTLGLVPLAFVVVLLVWNWRRWSGDLKLIVASIVSLHVVHLPYWFEGIMGWHYVFESAPLWAIVLGVVTADFAKTCRETGHGALRWWWAGVLLTSLATAWLTVPPLWRGRMPVGLAELNFPRLKYARFNQLLKERIDGRAIVFIQPDPSDRHIDFVYNRPQLDSSILRARAPAKEADLQRAVRLFPDRTPWLYDAASGELRRWGGTP